MVSQKLALQYSISTKNWAYNVLKNGTKVEAKKLSYVPQSDTVCFSSKCIGTAAKAIKVPKTQAEIFGGLEKFAEKLTFSHITIKAARCPISTKSYMENILSQIKLVEKEGSTVSVGNLRKFFEKKSVEPLNVPNELIHKIDKSDYFQISAHDYLNKKTFGDFVKIMKKTPPKDEETASSYLKRIMKIQLRRTQQLEKGRIDAIKYKLSYFPDVKEEAIVLTPHEKSRLIRFINKHIELDNRISDGKIRKLLPEDASFALISKNWRVNYLNGMNLHENDPFVEKGFKAVLQGFGRYNSKKPPLKNIETECIKVVQKDYQNVYEHEPVYRWLIIDKPNSLIKKMPKNGETYQYNIFQSCSTHKNYAEPSYCDDIPCLNVKFVIHPKSETSKAYNLGIGQEVIYAPDTKFRILDKSLVEDVVEQGAKGKDAKSICRWEVHMQEL